LLPSPVTELKKERFDTTGDCVVGMMPNEEACNVEFARTFEQILVSERECLDDNERSMTRDALIVVPEQVPPGTYSCLPVGYN